MAANTIADDGDEQKFCSTCAFGAVCVGRGVDKLALTDLHCLVEHVGPYRAGESIFRTGDRFGAIFAVRSGTVKTRLVDLEGREQVLDFHLPGELIGLNAIHPEMYPCDAIALDSVEVCRFSFPALATLATRIPQIQQELFRRLSKGIGDASVRNQESSADERLAAFLLELSARYAARGFATHSLRLSMSRSDIANYLGLAAETVSRVLRRFQDRGLLDVDGREVAIGNVTALRDIARNLLRG
ncbi:MAG: helix-turn-helix domain-containing protein [Dokdonella sp.]